MMSFKKYLVAALLTGCSFKAPSLGTQPYSAAFTLTPVTALRVETLRADALGLASQKAYHLKTCAKDVATKTALVGQSFTLSTAGKHRPLTADADGCVYWTETIDFRFLANEVYVELKRVLKAPGGSIEIVLLANPWETAAAQGLFDRRSTERHEGNTVSEDKSRDALLGVGAFAPAFDDKRPMNLKVDKTTVSAKPVVGSAGVHHFAVTFRLKARRRTLAGTYTDVELPSGLFHAQLALLESNEGAHPDPRGQSPDLTAELNQGQLDFKHTLRLASKTDKTTSKPVLFCALSPASSQTGLDKIEGLFTLGSLDGVNQSGELNTDKTAVGLARSALANRTTKQNQTPSPGFVLDGSTGLFQGEGHYNAKSSKLSAQFIAEIRVLDGEESTAVRKTSFRVTLSDSPEWPEGDGGKPAETDGNGTLFFTDGIEYLDLAPEQYFRKYLLVRGTTDRYPATLTQALEVHINPWQRNSLFYQDVKTQGLPAFESTENSVIVLPSYSAVFLDRSFEINNQLQLTTLRRFSVCLKPGLVRPNPEGDYRPKPLRPGTRLKLVGVLADPSHPEKDPLNGFLAGFETAVQVDASGEIHATAVFAVDFTQQPRLDSRTRIHLTLAPQDDLPGLPAPVTLSANFLANTNGSDISEGRQVESNGSGAVGLPSIPEERTRRIRYPGGTAFAIDVDWKLDPLALYQMYWKGYGPLQTVVFGSGTSSQWIEGGYWKELNALGKPLAPSFWDFLEGDGSDIGDLPKDFLAPFCRGSGITEKGCETSPGDFFHLSHFTLVDRVLDPSPLIVAVHNPFIQLVVSFFSERQFTKRSAEGEKTSNDWKSGLTARLGYEVFGNGVTGHTSITREYEWLHMEEAALGNSSRSRFSVQEQVLLSEEELVLELSLRLRHCVLVRPLPFSLALTRSGGGKATSFIFCSEPKDHKHLQESWYSIRDRWNQVHSVHSDPRDPGERGWTKLVRGRGSFDEFRRAIGDPARQYVFHKIEPFFDGVDTLAASAFYTPKQVFRLNRDGGIFPGVLDYTESSSLQWRQPQIEHYTDLCLSSFREKATDSSLKIVERGQRYCRCYFETAARRWPHERYLKQSKDLNALLEIDGTRARCVRYAGTNE